MTDVTGQVHVEQSGELSTLLRDIGDRLSTLGRETEAARKLTEQITTKLALVEESLVMHQEQTETSIVHLQEKLVSLQGAQPVPEKPPEEEPLAKESFFRRIFGV